MMISLSPPFVAQLLFRSNILILPSTRHALRSPWNVNTLNVPTSKTCESSPPIIITRLYTNAGDNNSGGGLAQDLSEMFDLYNPPTTPNCDVSEPPTKTGQSKKRSLVHKDGDWHRSVHIWVIEKDNENLLLQRRSPGKDTFPNCLDVSCAGHVTSGDDVDVTAIRELEEELGMKDITMDTVQQSRAFTIAASVEGETPSHGKFICQEYQEVYVLRWQEEGKKLDVKSFAPLMEEEVSGFEVANIKDVLLRLEKKDEELVPRSLEYVQALRAAIFDQT